MGVKSFVKSSKSLHLFMFCGRIHSDNRIVRGLFDEEGDRNEKTTN